MDIKIGLGTGLGLLICFLVFLVAGVLIARGSIKGAGATCPNCGQRRSKRVERLGSAFVMGTLYQCTLCGHMWKP